MKQKDLLFLLISSSILVVIWIIFNILHHSLTSTITDTVGQELNPIAKTFDQTTFDILKKRQKVTPVVAITIIPSITPSPTPLPITPVQPISSESAKQASGGASTQ